MKEKSHEYYIQRCLDLAKLGLGNVAPNPMVGSVIVHDGKIIGEGYHQVCGEAHAEINAIHNVSDKKLLKESTLYVNLEPCSHFGKTPPCSNTIIDLGIPRVVIGNVDPNPKVAGRGIQRMQNAGIEVIQGILEEEGRFLNRRFFTFQEKNRPYIILKWAETSDGFIDILRKGVEQKPMWITNQMSKALVHKWRVEEPGIMVGTNTALLDNPQLTPRMWNGRQPLRIVPDRNLRLPQELYLFDGEAPTIVFTEKQAQDRENISYVQMAFDDRSLQTMMNILFEKEIQSVIVEGGTDLLNNFISQDLWDEARIFIGNGRFGEGVKAPILKQEIAMEEHVGDSKLLYKFNADH